MKRPDFSWDHCPNPEPIPPDIHWAHAPLVVNKYGPRELFAGEQTCAHGRWTSAEQTDDDGGPNFFIVTTICIGCGHYYTFTEDV